MLRHPNIVQIMAISIEKNQLYIISELVDGPNLEELIFFETDDQPKITITPERKESIGKKLCSLLVLAVAYLHVLKPPVIHRDIKPANVLISLQSSVAKLCNMGISKLKEIQTMTKPTSGIPGTPSYMAPECLLQNKKATVHFDIDIWSLACTLLELYTEKECWELDDSTGDDTLGDAFKRKLRNQDCPPYLESVVEGNVKEIIRKCFNDDPSLRPSALDLITVYSSLNSN